MLVLGGTTEFVLVRHGESRGNVADRAAQDSSADRLKHRTRAGWTGK